MTKETARQISLGVEFQLNYKNTYHNFQSRLWTPVERYLAPMSANRKAQTQLESQVKALTENYTQKYKIQQGIINSFIAEFKNIQLPDQSDPLIGTLKGKLPFYNELSHFEALELAHNIQQVRQWRHDNRKTSHE